MRNLTPIDRIDPHVGAERLLRQYRWEDKVNGIAAAAAVLAFAGAFFLFGWWVRGSY